AWRRKAPVEALMPLRLARIGVPLSQTAPEGLAAAGLEPILLRSTAPEDSHEVTLERADTNEPAAVLREIPAQPLATGGALMGEAPGAETTLLGPVPDTADVAGGRLADGSASPTADSPATEFMADGRPTRPVADQASATPHPFFAPRVEPEPAVASAPPAVPRRTSTDSSTGGSPVPRQQGRDEADAAQAPLWDAEVTDAGTAARLPEQQAGDDDGLTEADRQVRLVADWLDEAEAEGEKLAGAEVSRRLGVSPRTGQRRLNSAIKYRDERQHKSVRAHLRAVRTPSR
ncbi:hypothetical protein ACGFYJ_34275, partial [Streptomyces xanthophaeus]